MSFENSELEPAGFAGIVRLFPLPNLVMFPNIMQPLHIFEPRYRQMLSHALQGDGLIATALYRPDWENCLSDDPPIFDVVTISKVIANSETEDGRCNLLLKGVSRARIIREIPTDLSYRMADVELLPEPNIDITHLAGLRSELLDGFFDLQKRIGEDGESSTQLMEKNLPLGTLADMIAFSIDLGIFQQQQILGAVQVTSRCRKLIQFMDEKLAEITSDQKLICEFPPEFSYN